MSMIAIIIVVILICSAMSDSAAARDWEILVELAELRHQELMDLQRENHKDLKRDLTTIKRNQKRNQRKKSLPEDSFVERKRYIRDKFGNVIAEEILVSQGKSKNLEDFYDDYDDFDNEDDFYDDYNEDNDF